jgi:hypothetical protein
VELLAALGYELATIQVADSTRVADEKFLGFALGRKAQIEKFDRTAHRKKREKIDRPPQSTLLGSRQQQQQLSRDRLNRASA